MEFLAQIDWRMLAAEAAVVLAPVLIVFILVRNLAPEKPTWLATLGAAALVAFGGVLGENFWGLAFLPLEFVLITVLLWLLGFRKQALLASVIIWLAARFFLANEWAGWIRLTEWSFFS